MRTSITRVMRAVVLSGGILVAAAGTAAATTGSGSEGLLGGLQISPVVNAPVTVGDVSTEVLDHGQPGQRRHHEHTSSHHTRTPHRLLGSSHALDRVVTSVTGSDSGASSHRHLVKAKVRTGHTQVARVVVGRSSARTGSGTRSESGATVVVDLLGGSFPSSSGGSHDDNGSMIGSVVGSVDPITAHAQLGDLADVLLTLGGSVSGPGTTDPVTPAPTPGTGDHPSTPGTGGNGGGGSGGDGGDGGTTAPNAGDPNPGVTDVLGNLLGDSGASSGSTSGSTSGASGGNGSGSSGSTSDGAAALKECLMQNTSARTSGIGANGLLGFMSGLAALALLGKLRRGHART